MAHPALASLIKAVALVRAPAEGHGSGFFMCRFLDATRTHTAVFLLTNKHVLGKTSTERERLGYIEILLNIKRSDGIRIPQMFLLPLRTTDGHSLWAGHPNCDVDVVAISCGGLLEEAMRHDPECVKVIEEGDLLASPSKLKEFEVGAGDDVLILGFPLGLAGATGVDPIVRQGVVASAPGEQILECGGLLPGFRVDAGITPGGSGSVVILKPSPARFTTSGISLGMPVPPLILGIAAKAYTATLSTGQVITTGLGLVMDFTAIRETVDAFWDAVVAHASPPAEKPK
jgi:hypothetical protein